MARNLEKTVTDHGYTNWVKAGLSLKFAKNGIQNFVGDKVQTFQQNELVDICQKQGLPPGTVCNVCTTNNVLQCPNGICDEVRSRIRKSHRFKGPSWNNTDALRWYSNSWEWGKCYLSAGGYNHVTSALDTDFAGLISVIINHEGFDSMLAEDLSVPTNIFCQARGIRNEIFHTSTYELSDDDLNRCIDTLIQMLSDQTYLAADKDAQDAIAKLNQIKNGSLTVTTEDAKQMREEAVCAIREKREEAIEHIEDKTQEKVKEIEKKQQEIIEDIQTEGSQQIEHIAKEKEDGINYIVTEGILQVEHIIEKKQEATKAILTEGCLQQVRIDEKKEDVLKDIATEGSLQVEHIDEKKQEVMKYISTEGSQQVEHIDKKKQKVITDIAAEGSLQVKHIDGKKQEVLKDIAVEGSLQAEHIDEKKQEVIKDIKAEGTQQIESMEQKKQQVFIDIAREGNYQVQNIEEKKTEAYIQKKQKIQSDLIQQYIDNNLKTPICPLVQDKEADITELYVAPNMIQADPNKLKRGKAQETKIKSYKDMFYKNSKQCKKIYITGDAGTGKTALCQKRISTWCNAHSRHKLPADHISEDEKVMLEFQFLFYISLRHAGLDSNIQDMIKHQVLHNPDYQEILPTLLHNEKCLIVLDGLDEWTKPECSLQKSPGVNKGLPNRDIMSKCTILTTSRPWKLEVLRLKTSEIDQEINLIGLDDNASDSLIESVVNVLNTNHNSHKSATAFKEELEKNNIKQFRAIPGILKQLVCLWHDGQPLGETQSVIYSGMINLLFQLAEERLADKQECAKEWREPQRKLPKCFDDRMKCQEFRPLLLSLGRLSFETLFSQNREESLVFEHSIADMYGLSKTDIDSCLKVGILSQSQVMRGCTTQMKNLSFLHKNFQEYLAALYISTEPLDHVVEKIFSICNSAGMVASMANVFMFISGLNPETASKLSKRISDVVSQDIYTQEYRHSDTASSEVLEDVQNMMVACVKESLDSSYINIRFQLEDIFIKSPSKYLEYLIRTNIKNIKSVHIGLSLPIELQKSLLQIETLYKLVMECSSKPNVYLIYNLVIKSKESLQCLYLTKAISELTDFVDEMSRFLTSDSMFSSYTDISELPKANFDYMLHKTTNLEVLRLENIKMSTSQLECLMSFLPNAKQLRTINLGNVRSSDNCFHSYKLNVSHLQHLQWLCLRDVFLKEVDLNTSVLKKCNIAIQYPGVTSSVLEKIQHAPQLQLLTTGSVNHQYPPDAIDSLISTLPTLVHLKEIEIQHIEFGEKELQLSSVMKNLKTVTLLGITMTKTAFCGFVDSIPETRHSVKVDIEFCIIKPSVEIKPSEKIKPSVEIKPSEKIKTTEIKPSVEIKPSGENKPSVKIKPSHEIKTTEEIKPSMENKQTALTALDYVRSNPRFYVTHDKIYNVENVKELFEKLLYTADAEIEYDVTEPFELMFYTVNATREYDQLEEWEFMYKRTKDTYFEHFTQNTFQRFQKKQ